VDAMKVAIFSTKDYDRDSLTRINEALPAKDR
jgi:hypothetical protein